MGFFDSIGKAFSTVGNTINDAAREAEKAAQIAAREAERTAQLAAQELQRQAQLAAREAEKAAREAERAAQLAAQETERVAQLAAQELEKQALLLAAETKRQTDAFVNDIQTGLTVTGIVVDQTIAEVDNTMVATGMVDEITSVAKDIGTPALRIVTDTAIDLANLGTGFQFQSELEGAKKEMSNVGLLDTKEVIEKNHYPELKGMEQESREKYQQAIALYQRIKQGEGDRNARASVLRGMFYDLQLLEFLNEELAALRENQGSQIDLQFDFTSIQEIQSYKTQWDEVFQSTSRAKLGVDVGNGVAAGIAVLSGFAKASKILKFGKLVGRASTVLTIVSIGLEVGMAFIELEQKKAQLEQQLQELRTELSEGNQDAAEIQAELDTVNRNLQKILQSVSPIQTEESWSSWIAAKIQERRDALRASISPEGIRERAIKLAKTIQYMDEEDRIEMIQALDDSLSVEDAKSIIAIADA
jgi:DNA repair exonuclease SbcCD ATPase subunit